MLAPCPRLGHVYHASQQPITTLAPAFAPSFNTTSLMNALHAASIQQQYPSHGNWLMDTGASCGNLPKFSSSLLHNSSRVLLAMVPHYPFLVLALLICTHHAPNSCCIMFFIPLFSFRTSFPFKNLLEIMHVLWNLTLMASL